MVSRKRAVLLVSATSCLPSRKCRPCPRLPPQDACSLHVYNSDCWLLLRGTTPVPPHQAQHSTGTLFSCMPPSLPRSSQQLVVCSLLWFPRNFSVGLSSGESLSSQLCCGLCSSSPAKLERTGGVGGEGVFVTHYIALPSSPLSFIGTGGRR